MIYQAVSEGLPYWDDKRKCRFHFFVKKVNRLHGQTGRQYFRPALLFFKCFAFLFFL